VQKTNPYRGIGAATVFANVQRLDALLGTRIDATLLGPCTKFAPLDGTGAEGVYLSSIQPTACFGDGSVRYDGAACPYATMVSSLASVPPAAFDAYF
jgi:hypothetical protein